MEEFRNTQSDTHSPERSGGEKPKKKRKLFILGSILIGVVVMLLVYFVLIATGVIRIRANELTIGTPSAVKTYDGTPLTAQDYEITSGALPEGYTVTATYPSYVTKPGKTDNVVTISVINEKGTDVTDEFDINYEYGELEVRPANLTIYSESDEKIYDGTPLIGQIPTTLTTVGLIGGHAVTVLGESASITDAGSVPNTFAVAVTDSESGLDVTDCYNLNFTGTLTVSPRDILCVSASANKMYDGTPLVGDRNVTVDESGLANGDSVAEAYADGVLNYIGSVPNSVHITIVNESGRDVTSNYKVREDGIGTLTIFPEVVTDLGKRAPTGSDPVAEVVAGKTGTIYLRFASYGEYVSDNGGGAAWVTSEDKYASGSSLNPLYYTAASIDAYGSTYRAASDNKYEVTVHPLVGGYFLPYYAIDGPVGQGNDYLIAGGKDAQTGSYTLSYYDYDFYDAYRSGGMYFYSVPQNLMKEEAEYRAYALAEYTSVPAELREALLDFVTVAGLVGFNGADTISTADTINAVVSYFLSFGVYDESYYEPESGEDYVLHFLEDGHGVSAHYASAATLVLRVLGVPARYVRGYASSAAAGETAVFYESDEHSWVEAYISGMGWVKLEVTRGFAVASEENNRLSIITESAEKVYDGTPLEAPDPERYVGALFDGHRIVAVSWPAPVEVGSYENKVEYVILNADGEDVTHMYDITVISGWLDITDGADGDRDEWGDGSGGSGGSGGGGEIGGSGGTGLSPDISGEGPGEDGLSDTPVAYLTSDTTGAVYLRYSSYGDYLGNTWSTETNVYNSAGEPPYNALYLTRSAMEAAGRTEYDLSVRLEEGITMYLLPYYARGNAGYATDVSDVTVTGDVNEDGQGIYSFGYMPSVGDLGELIAAEPYAEYEASYRAFVYDNYTAIPEVTMDALRSVIGECGWNAYEPGVTRPADYISLISAVAEHMRTAYTYDLNFAPIPEGVTDYVTYFLTVSKSGICNNFASAATLLYRALGIPARYVTGFLGETVRGTETTLTASDAHAWTEVYVDRLGWVKVEVTASGNGSPVGDGMGGIGGVNGGSLGDGSLSGGNDENKDLVAARITTTAGGRVYLRHRSYGDYLGNAWSEGSPDAYDDGVYSPLLYASDSLSGKSAATMRITDYTTDYLLPYYVSSLPDSATPSYQTGDVAFVDDNITGDTENGYEYTAEYVPYDYLTDGFASGGTPAFDTSAYDAYVLGAYTSVSAEDRAYLTELAASGAGVTDGDNTFVKISKVAQYISSVAPYNENYDEYTGADGKGLDDSDNVVKTFLTDEEFRANGGVCRHFASAAVMMLRALGIPARYTTGYAVTASADTLTAVTGADAHAWAEAYITGKGWVYVEATAGMGGSSPTEERQPLTVFTSSASKEYDGTPLECHEIDSAVGLMTGHTVVVDENGTSNASITEVGETDNILDIRVTVAETGADVTYLYDIEIAPGTLSVYGRVLTVSTGSATAVWSGEPLTCYDYELLSGELMPGHSLGVNVDSPYCSQITNVGSINNYLDFEVTDTASGEDVTYLYDIRTGSYGVLTIEPIVRLNVTTEGGHWTFDGEEHSASGFTYTAEAEESVLSAMEVTAVEGSGAVVRFPTEGTDNDIRVTVTVDGKDVTGGAEINYDYGKLIIDPVEITVNTDGLVTEYNGKPHSVGLSAYERAAVESALVAGHTLQVGVFERTDAGAYANIVPLTVTDGSGEDVTDGYRFTYNAGNIVIRPAVIIVTTSDGYKKYDGTPLVNGKFTVTGLVDGQSVSGNAFVTGTQTDPGSSLNTIDFSKFLIVDKDGNAVDLGNYSITPVFGTLVVEPA